MKIRNPLRPTDKFLPSTDLGALFASLLSEVEGFQISPNKGSEGLPDRYRAYAQKPDDWKPEDDPEFRGYKEATEKGFHQLARIRDQHNKSIARFNPPFITGTLIVYFVLLLLFKVHLNIIAVCLWFYFGDDVLKWAHKKIRVVRYDFELRGLLERMDALGDHLPQLQVGAPTPPRLLPPAPPE